MSLLIDIGNTRTKWFLTDEAGVLTDMGVWENEAVATVDVAQFAGKTQQALCAVVGASTVLETLSAALAKQDITTICIQPQQNSCGLFSQYEIDRLGVDRWLSLIAAYQSGYGNALVVTAGTALTIDALTVKDEQGVFIGGTITPGLGLMQSALHQNTANLPQASGQYQAFPKHTDDAIYSGAINALSAAVIQQWESLKKQIKTSPKLVLSGGDAHLIAEKMPPALAENMIIVDNLVLRGLMHVEKEHMRA